MQTTSNTDFVIGTFRRELKNRFLCEVSIDGEDVVCYVPSSCHLSNFLKLEGKQVLLVPTQSPHSRTSYALYAVKYRRSYILLNTSMANRAIELSIGSRRFSFLKKRARIIKEHTIYNYKTDLYLSDTDTLVEIKSIISTSKTGTFPTVYSERTINQLKQLQELLTQGHRVCFFVVSLCPSVKEIIIDKNSAFYAEFIKCVQLGMHVSAYSCRIKQGRPTISGILPISY